MEVDWKGIKKPNRIKWCYVLVPTSHRNAITMDYKYVPLKKCSYKERTQIPDSNKNKQLVKI